MLGKSNKPPAIVEPSDPRTLRELDCNVEIATVQRTSLPRARVWVRAVRSVSHETKVTTQKAMAHESSYSDPTVVRTRDRTICNRMLYH